MNKVESLVYTDERIWANWTLLPSSTYWLLCRGYDCFSICFTIRSSYQIYVGIFLNVSTFILQICYFFVFLSCAVIIWIFHIWLISGEMQLLSRIIVQPTLNSKSKIYFILQVNDFSLCYIFIDRWQILFISIVFFFIFVVFTKSLFILFRNKGLTIFHEALRVYQLLQRLTFYHIWIEFRIWFFIFSSTFRLLSVYNCFKLAHWSKSGWIFKFFIGSSKNIIVDSSRRDIRREFRGFSVASSALGMSFMFLQ